MFVNPRFGGANSYAKRLGVLVVPGFRKDFLFMKRNIYLMYAISFLQGMVFYGPIATLYRRRQGVSVFQLTVIESISLLLCILLEIPWGVVADKIGYKKTMVLCCSMYFVSKIIFWQASGFRWFLAERILLGIVLSGLSGVDVSILYLSSKDGNSQKVFGIYNSLQMAGLLAAALVFALFVEGNDRLSGLLTVISYGVAAVLALGLAEVKSEGQVHEKARVRGAAGQFKTVLRQTLCHKRLLLFLIAVAFLTETHQTITVFLNQLQYEKCGLDNAAIGYIYIVATLLGGCGICSSWLSKKTGGKAAAILLGWAAIISCIVLAFATTGFKSVSGILLLRISNSLFLPLQTEMQNQLVCTSCRATELSIQAMVINCIAVGTNLVFGALAEVDLTLAYWFGAGICTVSVILFCRSIEKNNMAA